MKPEDQATITAWQEESFGPTTPWRAFERMQKEYWELRDAVYVGDTASAMSECADVLITLYRVAELLGCDLHAAVNAKMAVNRTRQWVVDDNGHGQHV